MKTNYILKSERLGFRNWSQKDLPQFTAINADPDVMEHFPKPLTEKETFEYIQRLQKHYEKNGFNYFAVEVLETGDLIGFIGLAYQVYESEFTPAVDIGWRLKKSAWGKGYAIEGAKKCLEFAFNVVKLEKVISVCPLVNYRSQNVMKKLGMLEKGRFDHPNLKGYPELEPCVCYEISREQFFS